MAKLGSVWRCSNCGNAVIVIHKGRNQKVGCCGMPMKKLKAKFK